MAEMELLALLAIALTSVIGWVLVSECLGRWIDKENRIFFAPAFGMAACAIIAYVGAHSRLPWLIPSFTLFVLAALVRRLLIKKTPASGDGRARRLFYLTLLTLLSLYGMQISVFQLFKAVYPGPHEVWDLFNASGVSPPDQMFSWHQAMFADLHRHYPRDPFYGEMDLYDRPHLGGYLTLFFFKLFHLPLTETQFTYPASALRFYHCFWWLSNNLYLFAIAPLFHRLFGYRGAVLAVASTALSGFIFLCNLGGWTKFSAIYPFLLAVLLFLDGKSPLLQAALCAVSFYLHGSVLPFLGGFGLFQLLGIRYPVRGTLVRFRDVVWFALAGILLVGSWFVIVRMAGSKQPLVYYYIYNAGITQAQTQTVSEIARAFYAQHSWSSLSLFPPRKLFSSLFPIHFYQFLADLLASRTSWKLSDFASAIFRTQRHCVLAAAGLVTLPVTLLGLMTIVSRRYSGRSILAFYLIPTLLIALFYRIEWAFSLHILCLYHAFILFLVVAVARRAPPLLLTIGLAAIAVEGILCVLFADARFLPVHGLRLEQLIAGTNSIYLVSYLALLLLVIAAGHLELRRFPPEPGLVADESGEMVNFAWLVAGRKLAVGVFVAALVIAIYSLYCLRFY
ncbi:MAG: hypothetical protein QOI49_1915 [Verrucomicrobiota bacterium]|jgi:hypothetical protein